MDDLIEEFLAETGESLAELDLDIVSLEQNTEDQELIGKIFRLVHTIKGTCGFLGLPRLETVAHHGENVLGRFRDGNLAVTPEYVTLILEAFDRIKEIVAGIAETGSEPEGDDSALLKKLDDVYNSKTSDTADVEDTAPAEESADNEENSANDQEDLMSLSIEELAERAAADAAAFTAEPEPEKKPEVKETAAPAAQAQESKAVPEAKSLRVNVQVLENLMTMVSELVLNRNQLLQILRRHEDSEFTAPLQRLNQVVSELQDGVMKTRMQPVGNAWGKLPRIIRDISMELGKKINLEMRGQDTELDRQVLELIKDPLTHMVRNSGDHGIELPADRLAVGKSEEGHILLNAFHEGGYIIIEISDDGRGLSTEKIKEKILANNLASADELEQMTEQNIHQFIFHAGLSTAEAVTAVSGRGVGMDVVRTNIEKIGGTVELRSEEGKGSTFTIKIPLTLAIVSAMIIEAAGERFAIPQLSVQELVRAADATEQRIENINGTPVLRLRDRLLPLISLSKVLKLERDEEEETVESGQEETIVVMQVGAYTFGIMVDRVFDMEEIVVKPVPRILRHIEAFSGNTILGDGSVIMILDPNGIASMSGEAVMSENVDLMAEEEDAIADQARKTSLLVFRSGQGALKAVPLQLVSRLEEINAKDVEETNSCHVIQYRGTLMPLFPFENKKDMVWEGNHPALVFSENNMSMGIIVDEIVDIVEEVIDVQLSTAQDGILGSAIIDGMAMDVVDVGHYLGVAHREYFGADAAEKAISATGGKKPQRILVVDDSAFFQNMLIPLLNVAGYDVTTVDSADEAFALREQQDDFDIIISDIEMPGMDGFDFVQEVKKTNSLWKDTPIIALSAHSSPQNVKKGLEAGFEKYVMKFDKEKLLETLQEILATSETEKIGDVA